MNELIFNNWTNDFYKKLCRQNQKSLYLPCMGEMCAYSPLGEDGKPLSYCVRDFIEKNYSKEFLSSFCVAEINKRGVYSNTEGKAEHEIALKYKSYADDLRKDYPKCALIFDMISEDYESQSEQEKMRAQYED